MSSSLIEKLQLLSPAPTLSEICSRWDRPDPLISVLVPTYNHGRYISTCLDSILSQETVVPFEILIRDDASTDGTRPILRAYEANYAPIVRVIQNEERLYPKEKALPTFAENVRGRFIAICEGDDFWINRHKLQRQLEILERFPDLVATAHSAAVLHDSSATWSPPAFTGRIRSGDLDSFSALLPPVCLMMRTEALLGCKRYLTEVPYPDAVLKSWLCARGDAYIEGHCVDAVHRIHRGGVFSGVSLDERLRLSIETLLVCGSMFEDLGEKKLAGAARRRAKKHFEQRAYGSYHEPFVVRLTSKVKSRVRSARQEHT